MTRVRQKPDPTGRKFELCHEHLREALHPRTLPAAAISLRKAGKLIVQLQREVAILIAKGRK